MDREEVFRTIYTTDVREPKSQNDRKCRRRYEKANDWRVPWETNRHAR